MAEPQTPWDAINKPPWVEVLDDACDWAELQGTIVGVATEMTKGMYNGIELEYENKVGAAGYVKPENGNFDLSSFVEDIHNNTADEPNTYACFDTGQALVIYSGAVGVRMDYKVVLFFGHVNCIKPINGVWANNPFYGNPDDPETPGDESAPMRGEDDSTRSSFTSHAFAQRDSYIYDACFTVDTDSNPDTGPPHTETWLTGIQWGQYKSLVIDDVPPSLPGTPTTEPVNIE